MVSQWLSSKESACNAGDPGSIPGLGSSPGERHGNPLQYSCLENSMARGAWRATVHRVAKSGHNSTTQHVHTPTHTRVLTQAQSISYKILTNNKGDESTFMGWEGEPCRQDQRILHLLMQRKGHGATFEIFMQKTHHLRDPIMRNRQQTNPN